MEEEDHATPGQQTSELVAPEQFIHHLLIGRNGAPSRKGTAHEGELILGYLLDCPLLHGPSIATTCPVLLFCAVLFFTQYWLSRGRLHEVHPVTRVRSACRALPCFILSQHMLEILAGAPWLYFLKLRVEEKCLSLLYMFALFSDTSACTWSK